jgi:hypothetical protein
MAPAVSVGEQKVQCLERKSSWLRPLYPGRASLKAELVKGHVDPLPRASRSGPSGGRSRSASCLPFASATSDISQTAPRGRVRRLRWFPRKDIMSGSTIWGILAEGHLSWRDPDRIWEGEPPLRDFSWIFQGADVPPGIFPKNLSGELSPPRFSGKSSAGKSARREFRAESRRGAPPSEISQPSRGVTIKIEEILSGRARRR